MLAAITLILSFSLNGHIIYGLSFLIYKGELALTCTPLADGKGPYACNAEEACDSALTASFTLNKDETRLHNWVTTFDLVCTPESQLSLLGMTFFITFTIGSMVWLALADKLGRKPIIFYGLLFHAGIVLILLFVEFPEAIYIFMGLQGIQVATSCQVAYVLLLEMVPSSSRSFYCAALNAMDGGVSSILLPIFYYFVGNWRILFIYNFLVTAAVFVLL